MRQLLEGPIARVLGVLIVALVGCAESVAPTDDAQPADQEQISFRVAGFVKALGIT